MVVILMGVTGSGKTTVGHALAQRMGWQFVDADDFHTAENRAKMQAGVALTDADRAPWLDALHAQVGAWIAADVNSVLACSALKRQYRERLMEAMDAAQIRFVWLDGPADLIAQRLGQRAGHYMNPALLPSQLSTLEPPADALHVSIARSVPEIVQAICAKIAPERYADGKSSE